MISGVPLITIAAFALGLACVALAALLPRANEQITQMSAVSTLPVGQVRVPAWVDRALQAVLSGIVMIGAGAWFTGGGWVGAVVLALVVWLAAAALRLGTQWVVASTCEDELVLSATGEIAKRGSRQPRFAFYFSAPDLNRPTHVLMWYEELRALGVPFMIIVREQKHLQAFPSDPDVPVLFVRKVAGLRAVLPDSVTTVFYANNGQKNRQLINSYPGIEHIQLLHGDSDKPPSYSPMSQIYSKLFVAGQMAIDRYAHNGITIPAEHFRVVGRPQVAKISQTRASAQVQCKKIAYMPTWRGFFADTQFSSLESAAEVVDCVHRLDRPASLFFKPHPMSYKDPLWPDIAAQVRRELADHQSSGSAYFGDGTDPFDLYNEADVLITDISSVMIDFLYSGKPYLVIKPNEFVENDLARFPSMKGGYLVDADLGNLATQLSLALGSDPMKEQRLDTRAYAFGDIGRPPGAAFRAACREVLDLPDSVKLECA